ncbi:MAG TPA: AAA family ATPase [Oligoflexus sp.]|uniref:protein kinase domain-containing protein n=1 Tax=Oligoflexus sp. TaxID=1971216 RepID=UPI002D5B7C3C|nr:AAA family ATPase [Oligoflexus sp.]HYX37561.1 AAA family ATPase [Oligoflexus sp.]
MILVPGYTIQDEIFVSNHSKIYKAVREKDLKPVVIKVLSQPEANSHARAGLKREFRLLNLVQSPFIIKAIELMDSPQLVAIVLEDFGAIDTSRSMQTKPFTLLQATRIALATAKALAELHEKKIIHKDITPRNLLVHPTTLEVKIIDLGISSELEQESQEISTDGQVEGSLPYISPEQTGRISRALDYRTDFYSLGITFFELITGKPMFTAADHLGYVHCHLAEKPRRADLLNPKVPRPLADIIAKLVTKDPEGRYQSSYALISDLERCCLELETIQTVATFPIAQSDIPEKFTLTQKLHGREQELKVLFSAFHNACQGSCELLLVNGRSGIGKSRFVNELKSSIFEKRGFFIQGKFEQFARNSALSTLPTILTGLAEDMVRRPREDYRVLKDNLAKALGANGQVVVNIAPDFASILGPQPDLQELNTEQKQARQRMTMVNLFRTCAQRNHPLVMFLDDLQWADTASISLISDLLRSNQIRHLVIICAYRDNEVDPSHPFARMIQSLQEENFKPGYLTLGPIDQDAVAKLIAEAVHRPQNEVRDLAQIIHTKTEGSPFFIKEYLTDLFYENFILFDRQRGTWVWDIDKIRRHPVPDNVVEFMIEKLKKLPETAVEALQTAACLGSEFDLKTLARVLDRESAQVLRDLGPAIKTDLMIPLDRNYRYLSDAEGGSDLNAMNVSLKFQHDRIQQACRDSLDPQLKQNVHLRIARMMAAADDYADKSVELARHYSEALHLITTREERHFAVRVHLKASMIAKNAASFHAAFHTVKVAETLLKDDSFATAYELKSATLFELCDLAFFIGQADLAQEYGRELIANVTSDLEKIRVFDLEMTHFEGLYMHRKGLKIFAEANKVLGIKLPKKPNDLHILLEIIKVKWALRKKTDQDLMAGEAIQNPLLQYQIRLLIIACIFHYWKTDKNASLLFVMKALQLSLRHGLAPEVSYVYATYSVLLHFLGDQAGARRFGEISVALAERFDDLAWKSKTYLLYEGFIYFWHFNQSQILGVIQKSNDYALRSGNKFSFLSFHQLASYPPLNHVDDFINTVDQHEKAIKESQSPDIILGTRLGKGVYYNLKGLTAGPDNLDWEGYTESRDRKSFSSGAYDAIPSIYRAKILYFNGQMAEAMAQIRSSCGNLSLVGNIEDFWANFLFFLVGAGCYHSFSFVPKLSLRLKMHAIARKMQKWARHNPANFHYAVLLFNAEYARLHRKPFIDTLRLYDAAVAEARSYSKEVECIAVLAAFRYIVAEGTDKLQVIYLAQTLNTFLQFGATRVFSLLKDQHPELYATALAQGLIQQTGLPSEPGLPHVTESVLVTQKDLTMTTAMGGRSTAMSLDLNTVMKVSQSLSSEISVRGLLSRLLGFLVENSGAEKVLLVRIDDHDKQFHIHAKKLSKAHAEDFDREQARNSVHLSQEMLDSFVRLPKAVLIHDAQDDKHLKNDPYIKDNRVLSILLTPILRMGRLAGFIYLENNSMPGAFNSERARIVDFLASQAAVSLENVELYEQLEEKVREKTEEIKLIMANIQQGILTVHASKTIGEHYSKYLEDIFETEQVAGQNIVQFLFHRSELNADAKSQCVSVLEASLGEDILNYQMNQAGLIKELTFQGRTSKKILALEWHPVADETRRVEKILVSIRDVTELRALEGEARLGREEMQVVNEILAIGLQPFDDFRLAARRYLEAVEKVLAESRLETQDINRAFIAYHTLKGSARSLGFKHLAHEVHQAEDYLAELQQDLVKVDRARLQRDLQLVRQALEHYENTGSQRLGRSLEGSLTASMVGQYLQALEGMKPDTLDEVREQIWEGLARFYYTPAEKLFADTLADVPRLAKDLGKAEPILSLPDSDIVFTPEGSRLLKDVLTHLMRNALDHGIETPDVHVQAGKPEHGHLIITLQDNADDGQLTLRFQDDGMGLNVEAIRRRALEKSLIARDSSPSLEAVCNLIFHSGLSSRDKVSDISGRGVGMDAVKSYLEDQKASIRLELLAPNSKGCVPFIVVISLPSHLFKAHRSTHAYRLVS